MSRFQFGLTLYLLGFAAGLGVANIIHIIAR
jgi:hypothetical protein